jgi:hypothetical protein
MHCVGERGHAVGVIERECRIVRREQWQRAAAIVERGGCFRRDFAQHIARNQLHW